MNEKKRHKKIERRKRRQKALLKKYPNGEDTDRRVARILKQRKKP